MSATTTWSLAARGSPDAINALGTGETVNGGSGLDTINLFGNWAQRRMAVGATTRSTRSPTGKRQPACGSGATTFGVYSNNDLPITGGAGPGTLTVTGTGDTVTAGSGNLNIAAEGPNFTFNDSAQLYADTITGFSQAAGDRIHLTTDTAANAVANAQLVDGGQDTLITLSDHSTILLKGVNHIDSSFFEVDLVACPDPRGKPEPLQRGALVPRFAFGHRSASDILAGCRNNS